MGAVADSYARMQSQEAYARPAAVFHRSTLYSLDELKQMGIYPDIQGIKCQKYIESLSDHDKDLFWRQVAYANNMADIERAQHLTNQTSTYVSASAPEPPPLPKGAPPAPSQEQVLANAHAAITGLKAFNERVSRDFAKTSTGIKDYVNTTGIRHRSPCTTPGESGPDTAAPPVPNRYLCEEDDANSTFSGETPIRG